MSHETKQGTSDPVSIAPGSPAPGRTVSEVLVGGGEMGALMRSIDWSRTPVGPVEAWPSSLKTLLGLLLSSASQLCVLWGPELVQFYNDGFRSILGSTKHPGALGQRARECWSELWSVIEPMYAKVLAGGSTSTRDGLLVLDRHGFLEECYFDYTYSPLRDDASNIAGILAMCTEVTDRVLGERRLRALGQLGAGSLDTKTPELACRAASTVLAGVPTDVPFALIYLLDENSTHARLAGCVGVEPGHPAAPSLIRIGEEAATWPLNEASTSERDLLLASLPFAGALPGGPWPEPPERAVLLPLKRGGEALPLGFLVAGISPRRALDEPYREFLRLIASQLAAAIHQALSLEQKAGTALPIARPAPRLMAPSLMRPGLEESFIQGGGEMGALMRSIDWSKSVLGPLAHWPQSLRTSVSTMLRSPYPIILFWGPEKIMLYNDPFRPILGAKHPETMGARGHEALAEEWSLLGPLMQRVMDTGEPLFIQDGNVNFARRAGGLREEAYFTWSYNPTIGETGEIAGLFAIASETTRQVIGERQMGALRELSIRTALNKKVEEIFASLEEVFARAGHDVPFALLYVVKPDKARLVACTGLTRGAPAAPNVLPLDDTASWPLGQVTSASKEVLVEELHSKFGPLPGGPWPEPVTRALLLPVPMGGETETTGVLVAGLSPLRALDDEYRGFLQLLARQLAASISSARAYEQERQRSEELAQLDRAKTAFFSNVSHEFRTPLTLMLGPLEDALSDARAPLPPPQRERLALVLRNANRLFKLVNTLLDYSRLEAGKAKATFQPMDLAALTAQLANHFESAIRRAGLSLTVECPPLPEPVWVDIEAWEKIVFNLLSNALKHTFAGGVTVSLRREADQVRLEVRDTGTGISPEEVPHIFERFHRVEGARSRSHEGSGIGLALVKELVGLHHGRVDTQSEVGRGTVFTVSLPLGHSHLPAGRTAAGPRATGAEPGRAAPYLQEALGWLPREAAPDAPPASLPAALGEPQTAQRLGRVLVADDNADLREYLSHTLSPLFEVELAADGQAALDAVRERVPDVVVTDVMMPRLSGFELLRALRASPRTRALPVVMLSARAGEEPAVEGMDAGADDYVAKPFSARELVARVRAALELSRVRRDIARQEALAEGLREALRARDAFLSVAGHELKTPLASFRLQLELLERGLNPETHSKLVDRLGVASRQLGHLSALVEGLLTVSELAAGQLEVKRGEVDLSAVVEEVAKGMKAELARAGCSTALDVERGVMAPCDGARIGQVLASLVRYALRSGQGRPLEVSLRKDGAAARLSVTGHGSSLSPEDRARIFGDFERAVPTRHYGSGLELWVARQVVQAHAGVFEVTDTAGGGTTFHILLPLLALPRREGVSSA